MIDDIFEQTLASLPRSGAAPSCSPDSTLEQAVNQMRESKSGCIVVLENGKVRGIFTERDYLLRLTASDLEDKSRAISNFMVKNPITVGEDCTVKEALVYMRVGNFRTLAMEDDGGNFISVITMKDLAFYITDAGGFQNG